MVRGSATSLSPGGFLEIQLSLGMWGVGRAWFQDPLPLQIRKSADSQVPYKMEQYLHTAYAVPSIYFQSSLGYL